MNALGNNFWQTSQFFCFSAKMNSSQSRQVVWKSLAHWQEQLAIGDQASVNENTVRIG